MLRLNHTEIALKRWLLCCGVNDHERLIIGNRLLKPLRSFKLDGCCVATVMTANVVRFQLAQTCPFPARLLCNYAQHGNH